MIKDAQILQLVITLAKLIKNVISVARLSSWHENMCSNSKFQIHIA